MDEHESRPKHWSLTNGQGNPADLTGKSSKPRPGRTSTISDEQIYAALEVAREHGYRPSKMATASGLTVDQCRKAWNEGYFSILTADPSFHGCRPLKEVIGEEQVEARARMRLAEQAAVVAKAEQLTSETAKDNAQQSAVADTQRAAELSQAQVAAAYEQQKAIQAHEATAKRREQLQHAAALAHDDLVESRALRGRSIRAGRTNAIALQSVSGQLLSAAIPLALKLGTLMNTESWKPTPAAAVKILRSIAWVTREANQAAQIADDMERRALGEPDQIIAVTDSMSLEQSVGVIMEGHAALMRARQRGTIDIPLIESTAAVRSLGAEPLPGSERAEVLVPEPVTHDLTNGHDPAPGPVQNGRAAKAEVQTNGRDRSPPDSDGADPSASKVRGTDLPKSDEFGKSAVSAVVQSSRRRRGRRPK